ALFTFQSINYIMNNGIILKKGEDMMKQKNFKVLHRAFIIITLLLLVFTTISIQTVNANENSEDTSVADEINDNETNETEEDYEGNNEEDVQVDSDNEDKNESNDENHKQTDEATNNSDEEENEDQVQAQLSPMSSTLLKPGVKNKAVVQLKKDLKKLGYGNFPANPSNVYGTVTANVVKDFQRANGLAVDGIAGSATLNLIESLLNSNLTTAQVIQLKKDLRALGFGSFPSNPSSVYGNVTKKVVKEFQAYAKLKQKGVADTQTLNKIKQVLNPPYRNG